MPFFLKIQILHKATIRWRYATEKAKAEWKMLNGGQGSSLLWSSYNDSNLKHLADGTTFFTNFCLVMLDTNDETGCMSRTSIHTTYHNNNHYNIIFILLQDKKTSICLPPDERQHGIIWEARMAWADGWKATEAKDKLCWICSRWETTALVHEQQWYCMYCSSVRHI